MRITRLLMMFAALSLFVGCDDKPVDNSGNQQKPEDTFDGVRLVAGYFGGEYYGDYYSPGIGNYYVHFSDNGFDEAGYALPNTTYFTLDLYSDYYGGAEVETLPLPEGVYKLDMTSSMAHGTFSEAYSKYHRTDDKGEIVEELSFEAGELVVTATESVLNVTIGGVKYRATFTGVATVADKRSATGEDVGGGDDDDDIEAPEGELSTLTGDYTMTLDNHYLLYEAYGDYYGTGLNNYTFAIWPEDMTGDHVQFDVVASTSAADLFYGEYTIGNESTPYSFFPGEIIIEDNSGYMVGSWYYTDDGVTMAPFVGGELTISANGSNSAKVEFSVLDDKGNTITGSWSGEITKI